MDSFMIDAIMSHFLLFSPSRALKHAQKRFESTMTSVGFEETYLELPQMQMIKEKTQRREVSRPRPNSATLS